MSKTKDLLLARQKELQALLKELIPFQTELREVELALTALEPKEETCQRYPHCRGCHICRQGWEYR